MIGIVFASEEEAQPFLEHYERGRFDGLSEGETAHDNQVIVSLTGTGKIKATLRTERLLQRYKPDRLFHPGSCTALREEIKVGDIVAASQVFEGDRIELAAPTYPRMPLEVPFEKLSEVTLVTQDHMVKGQSEQTYWQRIADITDMTGYAVAYVTATHGIPCHIIKVVTGRLNAPDAHLRRTLTNAYESMSAFLLKELNRMVGA